MEFMNEVTGEKATIKTEKQFERWSAKMDYYDILVKDSVGVWWYYTDVSCSLSLQ